MGLIDEKAIELGVDVDTWQDAIWAAGSLLKQTGCIEETYIQAIIDNMETYGPYFVLTPGVALAHASNKEGVRHTGVSLITLAKPIEFLETPNNPVRLVLCLAAADNESHLELLTKISELLMDGDALNRVEEAHEVQEVLAAFAA